MQLRRESLRILRGMTMTMHPGRDPSAQPMATIASNIILKLVGLFWWAPRLLRSGGVLVEVVFFESCRVTTLELLCIRA